MKRNLFNSIKLLPYTSGTAMDRAGFQSAVLAASVSTAGTLAIAVTECDTATGSFTAAANDRVTMGRDVSGIAVVKDDLVPVDLDLVGCKQFIKITVTVGGGAAATYALALGDPAIAPVED